MIESGPASPCINICVLDEHRECIGCRRTLGEITHWGRMSAVQQWAVIARLEQLRADEAPLIPVAASAAAR